MLDFRPPVTEDRKWVAPIISHAKRFGCDYSFGDMFIWQHVYNIRIASHDGFLFSINGTDDDNGIKRPTYGFPVGEGNLKEAIELIEEDSAKRGYELEMFGLNNECVKKVETLFPGKFDFEPLRDSFDYIYLTENLINLPGKKFHGKRNHIAAFMRENEWSYEPITADNLDECRAMNAEWERRNREKDPEAMDDELDAINISFENYFDLGFVGGLLRANGEVVAFTFGEEMNPEVFCTHIEKAYADVRGAYPMINREFAANALSQYKYINREDDTGSEGLRKAKLSYCPDILLEKYMARVKK